MTSDEAEPEEHPGVAPLALRRSAVGHGPAGLEMSLALSSIVNRAYSVAVVAYVYGATGSTAMLAAAASRYLAGLAAAAGTSFLLGRVRPKPLLLALNVLAAALLLACAQRMHAGAGAAVVIALAAAVRVVTVPLSPAATAMLPAVLGGRDLARAARRQNTIEKLALLVGPGAGGILLLVASPAGELAIIATLLPIAALATVRLPDVTVPVRSAPAGDVAGAGTRRGDSSAATLFGAFSVLAGFAYGCDTVLFAVLAEDRFDVGASGYGLLFACLGAGGLLAAAGANRATGRRHLGPLLVAALCLYCLPTATSQRRRGATPAVGGGQTHPVGGCGGQTHPIRVRLLSTTP